MRVDPGICVLQVVHLMNTTHFSSAVAEIPVDRFVRQLPPFGKGSGNSSEPTIANISNRPAIFASGITIPQFLINRIGHPWTQITAELHEMAATEEEYHQIVHGLSAFVETSVIGAWNQPRHGSGLLAGQPLMIGWRRRLYVCPVGGQLRWIPSPVRVKEPVAS